MSYGPFALAGSYGNWGRSGDSSSSDDVDPHEYWTAGISYAQARWGTSITYLRSWGGKDISNVNNRFDNIVFGADYQLIPGLTTYAELSVFDLRQHFWRDRVPDIRHGNNHGNVLIVGTMLNF